MKMWTIEAVGGRLDGQTLSREYFGRELRNYLRETAAGKEYEIYRYEPFCFDARTATATFSHIATTPWAGKPKPTKQYYYKEIGEHLITPCSKEEATQPK